jgi:hypothetical protein
MESKPYTHQCNICGTKFTSETAAHKHVAKRHASGALWVEGNKSLWAEETTSEWAGPLGVRYMLVCEDHYGCLDFTSKSDAMSWVRKADTAEFCEECEVKVGA